MKVARLPSPSLPAVATLLALAALAATAAACDARANRAECGEMLDKYVDMMVASDVAAEDLPPSEARAAHDARKAKKRQDPSYRRVHDQCVAEVTRREYRCAMKAPNPETWQACID